MITKKTVPDPVLKDNIGA